MASRSSNECPSLAGCLFKDLVTLTIISSLAGTGCVSAWFSTFGNSSFSPVTALWCAG